MGLQLYSCIRSIVPSLLFCAALASSGCSGGGGGASGGSDSGSETGVRVLHAAIDAAPVDVVSSLSAEAVSTGSRFAVGSFYQELPHGAQTVSLRRAGDAGRVIASSSAVVDSSSKLSFFLFGDSDFGIQSKLLQDSFPEFFQGALLRIVNGTVGAAKINSVVSGSAGSPLAVATSYGTASNYLSVSPGIIAVSSARAADGASVNVTSLVAEEGRAYTLLIAGQVGYFVKGVVYSDK
jgi:hypothetical protein